MRTTCILFLLISVHLLYGQNKEQAVYDNAFLLTPTYTFQIPGGELSHRFGVSSNFGFEGSYKFGKNLSVGIEGNFIWGNNVKETNIISNVSIQNSLVINTDGALDEINLSQRAAMARFLFGKSIFFNASKPNNGLLFKFGVGYLGHRILIDVDEQKTPQFTKEMRTGYDQYAHGIALSQFIGLIKLEKGKYVNMYFGIEFVEAITKNARPWDFKTNAAPSGIRYDMYYGFKLGWIIPVFNGQSASSEEYFYY